MQVTGGLEEHGALKHMNACHWHCSLVILILDTHDTGTCMPLIMDMYMANCKPALANARIILSLMGTTVQSPPPPSHAST